MYPEYETNNIRAYITEATETIKIGYTHTVLLALEIKLTKNFLFPTN